MLSSNSPTFSNKESWPPQTNLNRLCKSPSSFSLLSQVISYNSPPTRLNSSNRLLRLNSHNLWLLKTSNPFLHLYLRNLRSSNHLLTTNWQAE